MENRCISIFRNKCPLQLDAHYVMKSFITCTLRQILWGDQAKEDEMGHACRTHGRDEKCIQRDHSEDCV